MQEKQCTLESNGPGRILQQSILLASAYKGEADTQRLQLGFVKMHAVLAAPTEAKQIRRSLDWHLHRVYSLDGLRLLAQNLSEGEILHIDF